MKAAPFRYCRPESLGEALELLRRLLDQGAEPWVSTPQEARSYLLTEIDKWAKVVKTAGGKSE